MRRYSANYVFTNTDEPIRNGIIGVDVNGKIIEVIDPKGEPKELANTEFYNGVIVPGFINTHCHTELSHFKGKISPDTGLSGFVEQVRDRRIESTEEPEKFIESALDEMWRQGIVAVADICNTSDSFYPKQNSSIRFVNLIEVLGLDGEKAEAIIDRGRFLKTFPNFKPIDSAFLTPHSTYTLSQHLWEKLSDELLSSEVISIHLAESKSEIDLTLHRKGTLANTFQSWGFNVDSVPAGTAFDIVNRFIPRSKRVLFVHNTFLSKEEAVRLREGFSNPYFVLCPASNLFIENSLPDVSMLYELGLNITFGTDSLASAPNLSILHQLKIVTDNFPLIPFSDLLAWATINGAKALGMDREFGSIEIGKTPGLNLISPFDFTSMQVLGGSRVKRLV